MSTLQAVELGRLRCTKAARRYAEREEGEGAAQPVRRQTFNWNPRDFAFPVMGGILIAIGLAKVVGFQAEAGIGKALLGFCLVCMGGLLVEIWRRSR